MTFPSNYADVAAAIIQLARCFANAHTIVISPLTMEMMECGSTMIHSDARRLYLWGARDRCITSWARDTAAGDLLERCSLEFIGAEENFGNWTLGHHDKIVMVLFESEVEGEDGDGEKRDTDDEHSDEAKEDEDYAVDVDDEDEKEEVIGEVNNEGADNDIGGDEQDQEGNGEAYAYGLGEELCSEATDFERKSADTGTNGSG
ncbi:hypothetical protein LTS18_005634 [Coniosporium uncinatum]|uniref:Uncharacterized protein n=1 Tax=Coniosporium uncinatum TaxID=93489 RepID=A0ACC3DCF0_9PEZI|nr:hypothetical protein LTS18_005634 [Coniosporium uncinatum]